MSDDIEVIRRVVAGDVQSFRVLVERYQRPLLALIQNLMGGRNDCEDVAQEAFLAAYVNLGSYDPTRARFSTWLFTIARNLALNALKRPRLKTLQQGAEPPQRVTPETEAMRAELFDRLDRALAELPLEQRSAFVLFEIHGLSYEEIRRIEGTELGTVKSRISRAKQKLRGALKQLVEQPE
jgi:RNA polymerase sigma-70 factor (ECF subfamily)